MHSAVFPPALSAAVWVLYSFPSPPINRVSLVSFIYCARALPAAATAEPLPAISSTFTLLSYAFDLCGLDAVACCCSTRSMSASIAACACFLHLLCTVAVLDERFALQIRHLPPLLADLA